MSSTPTTEKQKHEWLVILPDRENVLEQRMGVRSKHFEDLGQAVREGFYKFGGATLDEPQTEGSSLKINGSVMLAIAESREEVVERLRNDVYSKNNVWDWDKVTIYPFKSAFREPV
ncbi:hypothetical protein ACLMJK_007215 [Lecanora helva]